ncbi:serine protein kinase RIO [Candidatus Woesearchaeota archaeon]|nr:serine protein kinase RIO [Candidatus Woesearchaeota archaeon]
MQARKDKFKTYKDVFDRFTIEKLFHLTSQGHFEGLESPISMGKEASVFSAKTKEGKSIAVKIYRLQNCNFNRMLDYLRLDFRYMHIKKGKRNIVFSWCQREFRNLLKAREANVRAPLPIAFSNNILVMEYIGNGEAAPKLKDTVPKNPEQFFEKIIVSIKRFYQHGMVHGDLSPFNILNHHEEPVFIDFSQAVPRESSAAEELLERDVENVLTFFAKHGVSASKETILSNIRKK